MVAPNFTQKGFRCSACGRLQLNNQPCVDCGEKLVELPDTIEEAIHDAVEQSAQVRYWKDPALREAGSVAALKRY